MGRSALLWEVFNRDEGDAPSVDLDAERRTGVFIRENVQWIDCCTDVSDGGIAMAAYEMAHAGEVGVIIDEGGTADLFGEDQGRYLVACSFDKAEALMVAAGQAGVEIATIGRFAGADVVLSGSAAPLAELAALDAGTLPSLFG